MTAWRDSPRPQTGFTLLELVVAITLMGVVLVLLYSGLRLGLNGWDGGEAILPGKAGKATPPADVKH